MIGTAEIGSFVVNEDFVIRLQPRRMFTRLRDGTVIPFMSQTVYSAFDSPDSTWNYFERPITKYTWDETYDDAWEEEEPEFEEGELPPAEQDLDPTFTESDFMRRASAGR